MNISIYKNPVINNIEINAQKKSKGVSALNTRFSFVTFGSLKAFENYNRYIIKAQTDDIKEKPAQPNIPDYSRYIEEIQKDDIKERLAQLDIPNYSETLNGGIRGESLSSRKNRKFLKPIKECGITKIIDLRDKYASKDFPDLCKKYGFEYFNIPVDSASVSDRTIIDNLPKLFDIINGGNYYISCAQGLHRTDIALSLNYIFNPAAEEPPLLIGHLRDNGLKTDDISRRINSIKKELTPGDLEKLGWDESFEEEFSRRKQNLYSYNSQFLQNSN